MSAPRMGLKIVAYLAEGLMFPLAIYEVTLSSPAGSFSKVSCGTLGELRTVLKGIEMALGVDSPGGSRGRPMGPKLPELPSEHFVLSRILRGKPLEIADVDVTVYLNLEEGATCR